MTVAIAATNTYSDNTGSVSSHPINLPASISAGQLLVVFAAFHGTPTVTDPAGWTVLVSKVNADTYRVYAKIASGSEGATVTVDLSGNARASAVSYRITGAQTVDPPTSSEISVSTAVDASTATPDPPNLTPSWGSAENLWVAVTFSSDGNFTFSSYPTNYTDGQQNVQTGGGTGNAVSVASRLLTATSEDPGTFTTVTSRSRSTYTLAVRPGVTDAVFTGTATGTFAQTGALVGTSVHAGTATATFSQTGAFNGQGILTGTSTITFSQTGDFVAGQVLDASFAGTIPVVFSQTGALTSTSLHAGTATIVFSQTGDLHGDSIQAGTATITFSQTGAFGGANVYSGTIPVVFTPTGDFFADGFIRPPQSYGFIF